MPTPQPSPSTRKRQGIQLSSNLDARAKGRRGDRAGLLGGDIFKRIIGIALLAWAVNYVTAWRYAGLVAKNDGQAIERRPILERWLGWKVNHEEPSLQDLKVPPQVVVIERVQLAVQHPTRPFRNATELYSSRADADTSPHFELFDHSFLSILGEKPQLKVVTNFHTSEKWHSEKGGEKWLFAHEAPVWVPGADEVWFCSYAGKYPSGWHEGTNVLSKFSLREVDDLWESEEVIGVNLTTVVPTPALEMTNGGTWYNNQLLLVQSGRAHDHAPNLALVSPNPPYEATIILNNYFGRQFNSLNDATIHPKSRAIFVTDPSYGFVVGFRPTPQMPVQVYRFDPLSGDLRVVADGFHKANGIAFSPDGKTAYIADSGAACEDGYDSTRPATVYAFDVSPDLRTQSFLNRRLFAYIDTVIPDGIAIDERGNVYVTSGDGVLVYNPSGTLLGKIFIGFLSANIAFAGDRLVILAEDRIFVARLGVRGMDLDFWK